MPAMTPELEVVSNTTHIPINRPTTLAETPTMTPTVAEENSMTPTPPLLQIPTMTPILEVDSLKIMITSALPARVFVTVIGSLPLDCMILNDLIPIRGRNTFTVTLVIERDPLALCTETLVSFSERIELDVAGLSGGPYTVTVPNPNGTFITETFMLPTFHMMAPTISKLPAACFTQNEQNSVLINLQGGYCLQYPVIDGATVHDIFPNGTATILGGRLSFTFEPVRAGLSVVKGDWVNSRSLDEIVSEIVADNLGAEVVGITTFAGELTQIVEGIEGVIDSRRYYLLHNELVYEVTLMPLTPIMGFEEAVTRQRNVLWQTIGESFTWLTDDMITQFSFCPAGGLEASPYINLRTEYCLLYPSHFSQQAVTMPDLTIFAGPIADPTSPVPSQIVLQIMTETANGRSLTQVVDEVIASVVGSEIEGSQEMLGGEPAIILTGLHGSPLDRDLYTIHHDTVYHLRLDPADFRYLLPDMTIVWDTVLYSFTFFPKQETPSP
jgi:hypothetical protein